MRRVALSLMWAAAISVVLALPAGATGSLPGRTLSYRVTSDGKTSGTVVARTAAGRIAIFGSNPRHVYAQYDGKVLWSCVVGRRCRILSRGAKARKAADFIETEFFKPYAKHGLARVFMTHPSPAGRRIVGGVASTCQSSPNSLAHGETDLLCVAIHGGFLSLLEAAGETYVLRRAIDGASPGLFTIPRGVWSGLLGG